MPTEKEVSITMEYDNKTIIVGIETPEDPKYGVGPHLDIRFWFTPGSNPMQLQRTKKGIRVPLSEADTLLASIQEALEQYRNAEG